MGRWFIDKNVLKKIFGCLNILVILVIKYVWINIFGC